VLLTGAVEVNALAQGALRQFIQWLWIEHPTFHLGGGHLTTELSAFLPNVFVERTPSYVNESLLKHLDFLQCLFFRLALH